MAIDRPAASKVLFALSVPFAALALLSFVIGLFAILVCYDGEDAMGGVLFVFLYAVFAAPAVALIGTGVWLRGWKDAKWGKTALMVLVGIPAAIFALLLVIVAAGLAFEKTKSPDKQPGTTGSTSSS